MSGLDPVDFAIGDVHSHVDRSAADLTIDDELGAALGNIELERKCLATVRTGYGEKIVHPTR